MIPLIVGAIVVTAVVIGAAVYQFRRPSYKDYKKKGGTSVPLADVSRPRATPSPTLATTAWPVYAQSKAARTSPKPSTSRHKSRRDTSFVPERVQDNAEEIQTTKRHIWLLHIPTGAVVSDQQLADELMIQPAAGWHSDRSLVLAILVRPESFFGHASGPRLRILPDDYNAATLPPISRQAVPIFTSCTDGWSFEGFYRLGHPRKTSVACEMVQGMPPELQSLAHKLGKQVV